jgi:RHS repeat-associated protein
MKKIVIFLVLLVLTIPFSSAAVSVPIDKLFQTKEEPTTETLSEEITTSTTYIYAGSKLLATKNNDEIKYHYQDRLGSDINSKSLPFGQEIYSEERFSFTGKELDQDLYYFGARYYNPNLGKFTSVDPLVGKYGNLAYAYVANNPMNLIDPTGKEISGGGTNVIETGVGDSEMLQFDPYSSDAPAWNVIEHGAVFAGNILQFSKSIFFGVAAIPDIGFAAVGMNEQDRQGVYATTLVLAPEMVAYESYLTRVAGPYAKNRVGSALSRTDDVVEATVQVGTRKILKPTGNEGWKLVDDPIFDTFLNGKPTGEQFSIFTDGFSKRSPVRIMGKYTALDGSEATTGFKISFSDRANGVLSEWNYRPLGLLKGGKQGAFSSARDSVKKVWYNWFS